MNLPDLNDVRRNVEKIRRVVSVGEPVTEADFARLHRDYADAVSRVNEELLACEALIDDNNASLAVQRAERTSILELAAALDFSDREAWVDFAEEQRLARPPRPLTAAARRLGRAIGPARQREPLLRTIRWHALTGSPLSVRLDAMRRMREVDETPEIWERDIRTFEEERLKQIADEFHEADQNADVHRLRTLLTELRDDRWLTKPAEELIQAASNSLTRHRATAACERIPQVLEQMRNAESIGIDGVPEGRSLRERLDRLLSAARLKADSDLARQAEDAVSWLRLIDEEEQTASDYQQLIRELEHSLDHNADRDALRSLQYRLQQFDDGIPEPLAIRLKSVFTEQEIADRRRHVVRIVGAIAAVSAVAALLFLFFSARSQRLLLEGHEQRLTLLIERQDLAASKDYIAKLKEQSPDAAVHPPIAALITQYEALANSEVERSQRFTSGVNQLTTSMATAATIEDADHLQQRLAELIAESDGRPSESDQISSVEQALSQKRFEIQTFIDEEFSEAAEALSRRRDAVNHRDVAALRGLLSDYRTLVQRPHISEELTLPVREIVLDVDSRVTRAIQMDDQDRLARSITQATGDLAAFHTKLTDYASRYPNDPRAIDFERVSREEAATWNQVEQQNDFVRKWSALTSETLSPKLAKELIDEADALFAKRRDLQQDPRIGRLVDYVGSVAARKNEFGADIAVEEMTRHFDSTDWYSELYMLLANGEDNRKERYYSETLPRPDGSKWKITAALSEFQLGNALTGKSKDFETAVIDLPAASPTRDDWLAPQVTFARIADRKLREMTDTTWEKTLLGLLEELHQPVYERMEPITRYDLTLMIIEILSEGSSLAKESLSDYVQQLKRLPGETRHNVFDPSDRIARQMRPEIEEVLAKAPKFADIRTELLKQQTALFEAGLGDTYRWVGWLRRDENNVWACDAVRSPTQSLSGMLWTAIPVETGIRFLQVGRVQEGAYVIDVSPVDFAEGRPVYVNVPVDP